MGSVYGDQLIITAIQDPHKNGARPALSTPGIKTKMKSDWVTIHISQSHFKWLNAWALARLQLTSDMTKSGYIGTMVVSVTFHSCVYREITFVHQ